MALVSCPECSQNISSEAVACAGCGFPVKLIIRHCPECGSHVWQKEDDCGECGFPFERLGGVAYCPPLEQTASPSMRVTGNAESESALITTKVSGKVYQQVQGGPGDMRMAILSTKSYTGGAIVTLILYWIFLIPGYIANIIFLSDARRTERLTGVSPPGKGCLETMWVVFFWIPFVIISCAILVIIVAGLPTRR